MTKHEARANYQTSYLYWHGAHHCWSASGRHARHHHHSHHHVHRDAEPANRATAERQPPTVGDVRQGMEAQPSKAASPEAGPPVVDLKPNDLVRWAMARAPDDLDWMQRWVDVEAPTFTLPPPPPKRFNQGDPIAAVIAVALAVAALVEAMIGGFKLRRRG
jgi:hypothetical protein